MNPKCDVYIKGANLDRERLCSVGIVGLGQEGFQFSSIIEGVRSVHYAELFGINFVLDKLIGNTGLNIRFFVNNQGIVSQMEKMRSEWDPKYKGQGFFNSMIDEIAPKERVFSQIVYEFARKDDKYILRAKDLAQKVLD